MVMMVARVFRRSLANATMRSKSGFRKGSPRPQKDSSRTEIPSSANPVTAFWNRGKGRLYGGPLEPGSAAFSDAHGTVQCTQKGGFHLEDLDARNRPGFIVGEIIPRITRRGFTEKLTGSALREGLTAGKEAPSNTAQRIPVDNTAAEVAAERGQLVLEDYRFARAAPTRDFTVGLEI